MTCLTMKVSIAVLAAIAIAVIFNRAMVDADTLSTSDSKHAWLANLKVNYREVLGEFRHIQDGVNGAIPRYLSDPLKKEYVRRCKEAGIKFMRHGGILQWLVYPQVVNRDVQDNFEYDWTYMDEDVDGIYEIGAEPELILAYMPAAIMDKSRLTQYGRSTNTNAAPPLDYNEWEEVCYQCVYHFNVERNLNVKYWEVWNEPNGVDFWPGTFEEYLTLYTRAVAGAKRADATIKMGGPVITLAGPLAPGRHPEDPLKQIHQFIQYCGENNIPLDFLAWHNYNDGWPGRDSFDLSSFGYYARLFRSWLDDYPQFSDVEQIVDEWGHYQDWGAVYSTAKGAAWVAAALYEMLKAGIHKQAILPFPEGVIKPKLDVTPTYNVFKMYHWMEDFELQATSDHPNTRVLASRSEFGESLTILVMNYSPEEKTAQINLYLNDLPSAYGSFNFERYLVDNQHSNISYDLRRMELELVDSGTYSAADFQPFSLQPYAVTLLKIAIE